MHVNNLFLTITILNLEQIGQNANPLYLNGRHMLLMLFSELYYIVEIHRNLKIRISSMQRILFPKQVSDMVRFVLWKTPSGPCGGILITR